MGVQLVAEYINQFPSTTRWVLCGWSFGGLVAGHLSNHPLLQTRIVSLALFAPAIDNLERRMLGLANGKAKIKTTALFRNDLQSRLDTTGHAEKRPPLQHPAVLVHGSDDSYIDIARFHAYCAENPTHLLAKLVVKDDHFFHTKAAKTAVFRALDLCFETVPTNL
jgi:pimeloyl-ACP methyl ester carboxylesterase